MAYHTVDGSEIRQAPVQVGRCFPLFTGVLYIPGGAEFLPSTVCVIEACSRIQVYTYRYVNIYTSICSFMFSSVEIRMHNAGLYQPQDVQDID